MTAFTWNGARMRGRPGDTVAVALIRNGVTTFAASRKRHRPLGLSGSFIQGVLATVDDVPNVRLDQTPLREGMHIVAQGAWPSPRFDLLNALRAAPARVVRGGFEHPRILKSGTRRFEAWGRMLSVLAGGGRLDLQPPEVTVVPGRKLTADVVVVGGGVTGIAEANAATLRGHSVVLVTRDGEPGRTARLIGESVPALSSGITLLAGHEVFGVYRAGKLVAAAPQEPTLGAVVVATSRLVVATGRRSCPPVVPGNDLPGVMEAPVALDLVIAHGIDLGRLVVVGTGAEAALAERLQRAGASIVAVGGIGGLERIVGSSAVRAVDLAGRRIACEALVHAGPWIGDPNLAFQATSSGRLRLHGGPLPDGVSLAGAAALPDEAPHVGALVDARRASICPCMDVTGGEVLDLLSEGMTHVEELKRQTSCGMGPCQGFPCWEMLRAVMRKASDGRLGADRPSHRDPRRAITVAQAAGLAGLVETLR